MKQFIVFLLCMAALAVQGADFQTLMREAKAAEKAKNNALVDAKYAAAYKVASNVQDKETIVLRWSTYLRTFSKSRSRDLLEAELAKDIYSDAQKQYFLYRIAYMYLWDQKYHEYALEKVKLALSMKGLDESGLVYFSLCNYAANMYSFWHKDYEPIISIMESLRKKNKNPSHLYTIHSWLATSYDKLNEKELAIKNYKIAVKFGKQTKQNVTKLEKRIKELEK